MSTVCAYCTSNPATHTDPYGVEICADCIAAGGDSTAEQPC